MSQPHAAQTTPEEARRRLQQALARDQAERRRQLRELREALARAEAEAQPEVPEER